MEGLRRAYAPALLEGDRATAVGTTRYANGQVYSNMFELEFDAAGPCTRFVEWWVLHPGPASTG